MSCLSAPVFGQYNAEFLGKKGLVVNEYPEYGVAVVRYHKSDNKWKVSTHGACDRDDSEVRIHRSVIYDLTTKNVVHVSPIRRDTDEKIRISELSRSEWDVSVYEDGTMITVFWNKNINPESGEPYGWTLSTRSKLHAVCKFTSDKLFRDLFQEAIDRTGFKYGSLKQEYSYTFILHHPDTRHIIPCNFGVSLSLVAVCDCSHTMSAEESPKVIPRFFSPEEVRYEVARINSTILEGKEEDKDVDGSLIMATIPVPGDTDEDLRKLIRSAIKGENEYENVLSGIVIVNRSRPWVRVRILTPTYEKCLKLRGDRANLRVNYVDLMLKDPTSALIREYISFYPEEGREVVKVSDSLREVIHELYDLYIDRHVKKTKEHDNLPHWSRKPIWDIHGMYLRTRNVVRKPVVLKYLTSISPSAVHGILKNREKELRRSMSRDSQTAPDDHGENTSHTEEETEQEQIEEASQ